MKPWRPYLWLALILGLAISGLGFWYLHTRRMIAESEYWGSISEAYLADAMTELRDGSSPPYFPVPFCLTLDHSGTLRESPACETFYRVYPHHPMCALQNLSHGDWDPAVVELDPRGVAKSLTDAMNRRGCHWLVLDVESLRAEDRDRFSNWSRDLAHALREKIPDFHSSIAVHGKVDAKGSWHGAEAQDWGELCADHDEIIIMAYDYNYPGVTAPGETAPLSWVESILKYAVSVCMQNQIRLGLAAYGYEWPTTKVVTERAARAKPGQYPYIEIRTLREQKIELARKYGVTHFFLWALGMD